MQYFQAVQQGKIIAGKSQMKLFEIAGFGMLTLTTKKLMENFFQLVMKTLQQSYNLKMDL